MAIITVGNGTTGGGGGAVTQLFASVLSSTAASFDITSIPGSYNHLRLLMILRSDYTDFSLDNVGVRFNNDSGSNHYAWNYNAHENGGLGTAIQLQGASSANSSSGAFSQFDASILCYAQTTALKTITASNENVRTLDGLSDFAAPSGGVWAVGGTAAITRITIFPIHGTVWAIGSACYLYGIT